MPRPYWLTEYSLGTRNTATSRCPKSWTYCASLRPPSSSSQNTEDTVRVVSSCPAITNGIRSMNGMKSSTASMAEHTISPSTRRAIKSRSAWRASSADSSSTPLMDTI